MCVDILFAPFFSSPGFQVVGGENSGRSDLGTIISSITPGGPADVNGCLKPGRLIFFFFFLVWVEYDVSVLSCSLKALSFWLCISPHGVSRKI